MISIIKERYDSKISFLKWIKHESLSRYIFAKEYCKDKIVVDAACGSAYGLTILSEANPKYIYFIDNSEEQIEKNKVKFENLCFKNFNFFCSDILSLPLKDESIEVFICFETIEHIEEDLLLLKEIKRVLVKNGLLLLSTPNRMITNPGLSINHKPFNKFHKREYSLDELINLVSKEFSVIEVFGQNPYSKRKIIFINKLLKDSIILSRIYVRMRQIFKLYKIIFDRMEKHRVTKYNQNVYFEFNVLLCKKP